MEHANIVIATLVLYFAGLVAIGLWASRRTSDNEDFFLGGRQLGPWVAAISYAASASSAWTLLGLSGAAWVMGPSVIWVAMGSCSGMLVAWFWIGPRLRLHSHERRQLTVTEFLAGNATGRPRAAIVIAASLIILLTFVFYVAAQFQGAGNTFASTFDMRPQTAVLLGAVIIMVYTLLGGFWAVSVTDTVQGLLMAVTAIVLPVAALVAVGGPAGLVQALQQQPPEYLSWTGGARGITALLVIGGALGIGFGTYGQPHLLVRFMALRDARALRQARAITIAWYAIVFTGMCVLGLAGRVLVADATNPETVFFTLTAELFPPVVAAVLLAAVLSAIMSTADSQLLVAASAVAHDLDPSRGKAGRALMRSRLAIVVIVVAAVLVALYLPEKIFSRVLFAWNALGAAFGPVVFLRLAGWPLRPGGVLASMLAGFGFSVAFYLLPNAPGDALERLAPFFIALAIALAARRRG
ncbi:sodium/proline symporter [Marinihelvus fidelis]|uniref:Sodium/proline symporter n=1 Tax=Marinihelvus fidelis TaxID=2613842 RepID=A0A5N0TGJ0_9GAMM|nr:sodium/proline symporter [Marinihelvus fidelis]KAA9133247.1 sodium/proline symporter [Marinihelvus fidelis]